MTALGRAVKFGPSLFKGLKDMADDDARAAAMKARFEDKGVEFAGAAPTAKEIKTHRARKEREGAQSSQQFRPHSRQWWRRRILVNSRSHSLHTGLSASHGTTGVSRCRAVRTHTRW